MRTADFIDIYNAIAHKAKLGVDETGTQLTETADFVSIRTFASLRLKRLWNQQLWPDLVRTEKRYFRDLWNSVTSYAASTLTTPVEVFYPGPNKYYQALAANTNQAPATLSGQTWTTNLTYWGESAKSYAAEVYDNTKNYVRGDKAYYPNTDRIYQLHAATSVGNLPTDTTKWGVLTEFDAYVAREQTGKTAWDDAFAIWDRDPKMHANAVRYRTRLTNLGLHLFENVPWGWLEYRVRPPRLTGNVFSATVAYAAGLQVYYASGMWCMGRRRII